MSGSDAVATGAFGFSDAQTGEAANYPFYQAHPPAFWHLRVSARGARSQFAWNLARDFVEVGVHFICAWSLFVLNWRPSTTDG